MIIKLGAPLRARLGVKARRRLVQQDQADLPVLQSHLHLGPCAGLDDNRLLPFGALQARHKLLTHRAAVFIDHAQGQLERSVVAAAKDQPEEAHKGDGQQQNQYQCHLVTQELFAIDHEKRHHPFHPRILLPVSFKNTSSSVAWRTVMSSKSSAPAADRSYNPDMVRGTSVE